VERTPLHPGTLSVVARCPRTGRLGIAVASGSLAVGSRCPHITPGVGAVAGQARTDPRLGALGLFLLKQGHPAPDALARLIASDPHREHRQVALVDAQGRTALHTGALALPWAGHREGPGVAVAGNGLAGPLVVESALRAFLEQKERPLEERLLHALTAGEEAGGQTGGFFSSALLVYGEHPFPRVDLRVDDHDAPVAELWRLYRLLEPYVDSATALALDPTLPPLEAWRKQPTGGAG